jgi:transposase-like protein
MVVSQDWLQRYWNHTYPAVPQQGQVQPKAKGTLRVQIDELGSFVDDKGNKQWVWLALDADSREVVGCCIGDIGDRSSHSAQA